MFKDQPTHYELTMMCEELKKELRKAMSSIEEYREALLDFKQCGLRADTSPTHDLSYINTPEGLAAAEFWHEYLSSIDKSVRRRAKDFLDKIDKKE